MKPDGSESAAVPSAPVFGTGPSASAPTPASSERPARPPPAPPFRAIASDALFGGAGEVRISHRGSLYRLKQTALGKLILTK